MIKCSRLWYELFIALFFGVFWCCQDSKEEVTGPNWSTEDRKALIKGLSSTGDSILATCSSLSEAQWQFQPAEDHWNIGQVVTHLSIHDALFYREMRATTSLPQPASLPDSLLDYDETITKYAVITDNNSGEAPWYLQPDHRWCQQQATLKAFRESRVAYIEFIDTTSADLRKYYSTNGRGNKPYRDLHQLVLVSISHNQRHLQQIQRIKEHSQYPH